MRHPRSLAYWKNAPASWGLEEFVEVVNGLIEQYLPVERPANARLRDAFNPRLVRYYTTMGLIAPPERVGKEARYGYPHLIQALVIRRLLFEGVTAPGLLKMLPDKTSADLEAILTTGVALEPTAVSPPPSAASPPSSSGELHGSILRDLMTGQAGTRPVHRPERTSTPPISTQPAQWQRIEVATGLELHVRSDFRLPPTEAGRAQMLLLLLEKLREAAPGSRK